MRQAPSGVRGLPRRSADWARCSPVVTHMNRQSQHAYRKHTRFRGARRPRGMLRYEIAEGDSRGRISLASQRDPTPLTHASRDMWHARLAAVPLVRPILPHALSKGKTTIDNSLHMGKQILHKIEFILNKYE